MQIFDFPGTYHYSEFHDFLNRFADFGTGLSSVFLIGVLFSLAQIIYIILNYYFGDRKSLDIKNIFTRITNYWLFVAFLAFASYLFFFIALMTMLFFGVDSCS